MVRYWAAKERKDKVYFLCYLWVLYGANKFPAFPSMLEEEPQINTDGLGFFTFLIINPSVFICVHPWLNVPAFP